MRKLDNTEIGDIKKWGKKKGAALSAARVAKKMKQSDLARAVNVKPADIASCERGTAKMDNALPNRVNPRRDSAEPKLAKSRMEQGNARFALP